MGQAPTGYAESVAERTEELEKMLEVEINDSGILEMLNLADLIKKSRDGYSTEERLLAMIVELLVAIYKKED